MSTLELTLNGAGQLAPIEVSNSNSLLLSLRGGTVNATGVTLAFEGSLDSTNGTDGTWFTVIGGRVNSNNPESSWGAASTLNANTGVGSAWRFNVANLAWFRVRASAFTAGNLRVLMSAGPQGIDPVPVIPPVANPSPTGSAVLDPSTASTNIAVLRNIGTDVYELTVSNPTGTAAFVKFYDKSTAPNLATDVPIMTIPVAAGGFEQMAFGYLGKRFPAGLSVAITGAAAPTDTTAAPAGVIVHLTRGA